MNEESIKAWLIARDLDKDGVEYEKYSWAVDALYDLAYEDPSQLLRNVVEILSVDSSDKTCGALGAGVLEELLVHQGEQCIDEIESIASRNLAFKSCFRFTFLDRDDVPASVYTKVARLKGT